jgi:hypothetical protein
MKYTGGAIGRVVLNNETTDSKEALSQNASCEYCSFEDALATAEKENNDPVAIARLQRDFLTEQIFAGLTAFYPSWDSAQIAHFSAADFVTVLHRCVLAHVEVYGVEAFTANGHCLGVNIAMPGHDAHDVFVHSFAGRTGMNFCATFGIAPPHLE